MPFRPEDGVRLPIPDPLSSPDDGRALGDRPFAGEPAAAVVVAIPLPALLGMPAQVRVQRAAGSLVGSNMPVDRLVADAEGALVAEPPSDLLGAPELAELGVDLRPVCGREPLIAA
jgi:hypothetical protein